MKYNKTFMTQKTSILAILALFIVVMTTSCTKNNEKDNTVSVFFNSTAIPYDSSGVWTLALTDSLGINSQGVIFSHSVVPAWKTWSGFVPSRSKDVADYSTGNWLDHQFNVMSGGGISGVGTPFMVAYWNSSEGTSPAAPSCTIKYGNDGQLFIPKSIYINNTPYVYYAMVNGTNWSKKFGTGDYLKLLIYGVTDSGTVTKPVEAMLADYTTGNAIMLKEWTYVNLENLGTVKSIFFQMESSDSGEWGMNTPAYFAIDRPVIELQ
jgi:hypothetical protein